MQFLCWYNIKCYFPPTFCSGPVFMNSKKEHQCGQFPLAVPSDWLIASKRPMLARATLKNSVSAQMVEWSPPHMAMESVCWGLTPSAANWLTACPKKPPPYRRSVHSTRMAMWFWLPSSPPRTVRLPLGALVVVYPYISQSSRLPLPSEEHLSVCVCVFLITSV